MKKKINALFLLTVAGMILSGCGSNTSSKAPEVSSNPAGTSQEALSSEVKESSAEGASLADSSPEEVSRESVEVITPDSNEDETTEQQPGEESKASGSKNYGDSSKGGGMSFEPMPGTSEEPPAVTSEEAHSSVDAPVSESFTNITEFSTPVEIHTAAQKEYLSYTGDYETMPDSMYPDGKSNDSDSLPVPVSWSYTAPSGRSVQSYSVYFGQKADLSDGYEVNVGKNTSANLVNPYLGTNYFRIVAFLDDDSAESSEIRTFEVDSTCPRNFAIGGMTNSRDIGGRTLKDGGKIKQGLIYRTSGYKYDYSTTITDAGKKEMLQHLKVKTEVNVADGTSYNLSLQGTKVVNLLMDYDSAGTNSSHHFSRNAESVKNFFNLIGDSSNYPVYFHCRIGTDRTGLCSILLNGLLGVSLNEIYQDYLFSNFGKIGEKRYIGAKAGQDNIQNYISQINAFSGDSFQNKVYNVLLSIGVSATTLNTIIDNLTEGTKAQGNDAGQVVKMGDALTGNGVTASRDTSDRNNPDTYYVLDNASKSVEMTFNAPADYKGQIVAYLGNSDHSSSKKIGDAIKVTVDGNSVAIPNMTYAEAGMGKCGSRMNYFPVILGEADLTAGSHTIKIAGTSNSMNVASICVFNADLSVDIGGGGQQQGGGDHTHQYSPETPVQNIAGKNVTTYLCDCGAKYLAIAFKDYSSLSGTIGSDGKISNGSVIKWDFPSKAGRVTLQFNIRASIQNHLTNDAAIFDASKYAVKANGVNVPLSLTSGQRYDAFGLTTSGQYFAFCSFDIDADKNVEIEFDHNNGDYRLIFDEQVRLVYA